MGAFASLHEKKESYYLAGWLALASLLELLPMTLEVEGQKNALSIFCAKSRQFMDML